MASSNQRTPAQPVMPHHFASSGEYHQLLRANMVAKRAELIADKSLRELLWFIQYRSVRDQGLSSLITGLVEQYRSHLGTAKMRELGCEPGRIYNAEEVRKIRGDFFDYSAAALDDDYRAWPLASDISSAKFLEILGPEEKQTLGLADSSDSFPDSYPASAFVDACIERALAPYENSEGLDAYLTRLCVDPRSGFTRGLQYWPNVIECLLDYRKQWCATRGAGMVETDINRRVAAELGYAFHAGGLVVISGESRFGKTHAAELFCDRSGGMARYVETPATNDEASFLRAIGNSLGLATGMGVSITDLRQRIEETFRRSKLMLVMDEGSRLFPQRDFRQNVPQRLEWLMAGIVNKNVPCAIITTPQWFNAQRRMEERNFWNSAQLRGRIGHYEELPNQILPEDMQAVARYMLPAGCPDSIACLIAAAEATQTYLAGMKSIVSRAVYEAGGKTPDFTTLMRVADRFIASNTSLTRASMNAPRRGRKRVSKPAETIVQDGCTGTAERVQAPVDMPSTRLEDRTRVNTLELSVTPGRRILLETRELVRE